VGGLGGLHGAGAGNAGEVLKPGAIGTEVGWQAVPVELGLGSGGQGCHIHQLPLGRGWGLVPIEAVPHGHELPEV